VSLTDAFLTESGGLRRYEGTSNRVHESYGAAPATGVAVVNSFTHGNRYDQYGDRGAFTLPFAVTAGNRLVCIIETNDTTAIGPDISMSDSLSQTWTLRGVGPVSPYGEASARTFDVVVTADDPSLDIDFYSPVIFDVGSTYTVCVVELTPCVFDSFVGGALGSFLTSYSIGPSTSAASDGSIGLAYCALLGPGPISMTVPTVNVETHELGNRRPSVWGQQPLNSGETLTTTGTAVNVSTGNYAGCIVVYGPAAGRFIPVAQTRYVGTNGADWHTLPNLTGAPHVNFGYINQNPGGVAPATTIEVQGNLGLVRVAAGTNVEIFSTNDPLPTTLTFYAAIEIGATVGPWWEFWPHFNVGPAIGIYTDFTTDIYMGGVPSGTRPSLSTGDIMHVGIRCKGDGTQVEVYVWKNSETPPSTPSATKTHGTAGDVGQFKVGCYTTGPAYTCKFHHYYLDASGTAPWPSTPTGFTPASLTGLVAWYDAFDASSFTYSSGTRVSQWADKSGAGRHLVQATTTKQPSRSGTQNGLPAVVFSNTRHDRLTPTTWTNLDNPYSQFVVIRFDGDFVSQDAIQSDGHTAIARQGGNSMEIWTESYGAYVALTTGRCYVVSMGINGAASKYRLDGTVFNSGNSGVGGLYSNWGMGGAPSRPTTNSLHGQICEHVVYNRLLSDAELDQVDAHLKTKWGVI
jgi:hypothetical protein